MLTGTFLQSLKDYVGFDDRSSAVLEQVGPLVRPHFVPIIDDFYAAIEAHDGARAAITGGPAQIERLKTSLIRWIDELFTGPHDDGYLQRRARIGRVHVRIALPQAYMFTAMDRIRVQTVAALRGALLADPDLLERADTAVHQILDIELAIMLETYREDLVAKNRTAERLATIGQFAAGIGHELRNPLGIVESSAFLLQQNLAKAGIANTGVQKHLGKITAEVHRATKIISDLLELARSRPPMKRPVRTAAMIADAMAGAHLARSVEVHVALPADFTIHADPDQLGRIFVNLLVNASQAMSGRGRVVIDGGRAERTDWIRVRDTGPGVPDDVRGRIFEALFTTKAKGTGLGLALCRRIAEAHGGTVTLEPTETGASFVVTLPNEEPS